MTRRAKGMSGISGMSGTRGTRQTKIKINNTDRLVIEVLADACHGSTGSITPFAILLELSCEDDGIGALLEDYGLSANKIMAALEYDIDTYPVRNCRQWLDEACRFAAHQCQQSTLLVDHLALMILEDPAVASVLQACGLLRREDIIEAIEDLRSGLDDAIGRAAPRVIGISSSCIATQFEQAEDDAAAAEALDQSGPFGLDLAAANEGSEPLMPEPDLLAKIGINLTALALADQLAPVVGREHEIERLLVAMVRQVSNRVPILVGPSGVGKNAIIRGLALRLARGRVPKALRGRELWLIDANDLRIGASYIGQLEERVKSLARQSAARGAILVMDRFHTVARADAAALAGMADLAELLISAFQKAGVSAIAVATADPWDRLLQRRSDLDDHFQRIDVAPTSVKETIDILRELRPALQLAHGAIISDSALAAAVELPERFLPERVLPGKAIDVLDEAASTLVVRAVSRRRRKLTVERSNIADVLESLTGIPAGELTESERDKLLRLEEILCRQIIGQARAVKRLSAAVRRMRAGVSDPRRPPSFLFVGPTGVGKSELSKILHEVLFGSRIPLVELDMTEYQEKQSASRLIGADPGYVGYEDGGVLTGRVRRQPFTVVLFDELEKAHPDVCNMLLQILEDGKLTDAHGRIVDFRNTIIICTTNALAEKLGNPPVGFAVADPVDADAEAEKAREDLKQVFRLELLNRFSDVIVFHRLMTEHFEQIALNMLEALTIRMAPRRLTLTLTPAALAKVLALGTSTTLGARRLRRAIERLVEDPLAFDLLSGTINDGEEVTFDVAGERLAIVASQKAVIPIPVVVQSRATCA